MQEIQDPSIIRNAKGGKSHAQFIMNHIKDILVAIKTAKLLNIIALYNKNMVIGEQILIYWHIDNILKIDCT